MIGIVRSVVITILAVLLLISAESAWAVGRCNARASVPWKVSAARTLTVEAFSDGPDCTKATVAITVREQSGDAVWTDAGSASAIVTFKDVGPTNVAVMKAALEEWVRGAPFMRQSDAIPDWPEGSGKPSTKIWSQNDKAGFPFVPANGVDRAKYVVLREAKLPLLCYGIARDTLACIAVSDDAITKIGDQHFPPAGTP